MIGGLLFRHNSAGTICTVHERRDHSPETVQRAEELEFVRDGFSWTVALAAPVVLLSRGAWLALAAYIVAVTVAILLASALGLSGAWGAVFVFAIHVIAGFEAAGLERWSLSRRGWSEVGVVSGSDLGDCERRFFDGWLKDNTASSDVPRAVNDGRSSFSLIRRLFSTSP